MNYGRFRGVALCSMLFLSVSCASDTVTVQNSATWLAAAGNGVREKTVAFKSERDALAVARQKSINSLERSARSLDVQTSEAMMLWAIADDPGASNAQKVLLDKIKANIILAEQRQKEWEDLRGEHQRKLAQATSSVVPVADKLGQTTKLLGELGEGVHFADQLKFYSSFFSEVRSSLKKLEEDSKKASQGGSNVLATKSTDLKE